MEQKLNFVSNRSMLALSSRVSSRIFCLGGKIVCKDQLCVKHAKFLSPFLIIIHQCTKNIKPEFLLLDIVAINSQNFWGGSWRV